MACFPKGNRSAAPREARCQESPFIQVDEETTMADATQGVGFRYSKVMAWGPPIVLVLALILMVMGEMTFGLLLAAFALVFWYLVRRRRKGEAGGSEHGV
jgi:hypothetical protein